MTYNFDPDQWYRNELAALQRRAEADELTCEDYESELAALDRRHDDMWDRLDGSYHIPDENTG